MRDSRRFPSLEYIDIYHIWILKFGIPIAMIFRFLDWYFPGELNGEAIFLFFSWLAAFIIGEKIERYQKELEEYYKEP